MKGIDGQTRVVDQVFEALRDAILGGELPPDAPLSVPALSEKLNVSRSPVREAVLQLVAQGLAVERSRRGCVVARIEIRDLLEIHDMRSALEALAVKRVASVTPALLDELSAIIETQKSAALEGHWRRFNEADRAFHAVFHREAENQRLAATLDSLRMQMEIALVEVAQSAELMERSIDEHTGIVGALRERDMPRAENLMREHILATRGRLHEHLSNPPKRGSGN